MKLKSALATGAAAGVLALAMPAHAGNYISVFGGLSFPDDQDFTVGPFTNSAVTSRIGFNTTDTFGVLNLQFTLNVPYQFHLENGTRLLRFTNGTYYSTYFQSFTDNNMDDGFVVGGAIGFDLARNFRAELEAAYRSFDLGGTLDIQGAYRTLGFTTAYLRVTGTAYMFTTGVKAPYSVYALRGGTYTSGDPFIFTGKKTDSTWNSLALTGTAETDGEISAFSLMANVWYDFDLGPDNPFVPFVGGGIGMARLEADYKARARLSSVVVGTTETAVTYGPFTTATRTSNDDWVFAWQVGAGLGYEFGGGMMLSAQYRYFSTGDVDVGGQDVSVNAHEALIGLSIPLGN